MTPLSLFPEPEVQAILDEVAEEYPVHTTLQNAQGTVILEGGIYNKICIKVRSKPDLLSLVCGLTNTNMLERAARKGMPQIDLCEIGMFKTVVPIFNADRIIGAASACGAVLETDLLDAFLVSKMLGCDEESAELFMREMTVITEAQGKRITRIFERRFRELGQEYKPMHIKYLSR